MRSQGMIVKINGRKFVEILLSEKVLSNNNNYLRISSVTALELPCAGVTFVHLMTAFVTIFIDNRTNTGNPFCL